MGAFAFDFGGGVGWGNLLDGAGEGERDNFDASCEVMLAGLSSRIKPIMISLCLKKLSLSGSPVKMVPI